MYIQRQTENYHGCDTFFIEGVNSLMLDKLSGSEVELNRTWSKSLNLSKMSNYSSSNFFRNQPIFELEYFSNLNFYQTLIFDPFYYLIFSIKYREIK